mgnify:CR=1 FL=1|tara:strand:+ start:763 stop:1299 length:537 start_codon:yes stop_codon:yes gene_type:complete
MKFFFFSLLFITFFSFAVYSADTNTVSSTVIQSSPSTANAPSVVVNNSDVCKSAASASIQNNVLGLATGITITDENCERIKLSRQLFGMGMKVAAVSLLSQDHRVFDAMWSAGTYPPINGKIGMEAKEEWLLNKHLIPEGSILLDEKKIENETKETNNDFQKFLLYGMALYIGFPILF